MNRLFRLSGLLTSATVGILGAAVFGIVVPNVAQAAEIQNSSTQVLPTDWAYQALKSLVERTGCLVGNTALFEPNRAATRNELAMGLNDCLTAMGDSYAPRVRFDTKEDKKAVQALQTEFKSELNSLTDRAKLLKSQTKALESQQFSTTTKIQGQVVFSFQGGNR